MNLLRQKNYIKSDEFKLVLNLVDFMFSNSLVLIMSLCSRW